MPKTTITACLVVYNEEKLIERCLESIKGWADEILIVHDGECKDRTLEIAARYTNKIFVREHYTVVEPHLVFMYGQATSDWVMRFDADEYFDREDLPKIREIVESGKYEGVSFLWEMWNGKKTIHNRGIRKACLFKKGAFTFCGVPQEAEQVRGTVLKSDIYLHHKPLYNNIAVFKNWQKMKRLTTVHAKYFFPGLATIEAYGCEQQVCLNYFLAFRKSTVATLITQPLKILLGQAKNGLWLRPAGFQLLARQVIYYTMLYWEVWRLERAGAGKNQGA